MTVDIFYRSYRGDFEWLKYSLASTKKFCKGFNRVHVVVPVDDVGLVPPDNCVIHPVTEKIADGYMQQQADKLHADLYCAAPFVCHIDSDTIWTSEMEASSLFDGGKPVMLLEECPDSPWPLVSEKTLGFQPQHEFMRRHPFVYPRDLYREFRRWIFLKFQKDIISYIKDTPNREFSEFHTFGAWCYEFHRDRFTWKHPSEWPVSVKQHWSWGGITPEIRQEIEKILE
jgi:hypothetical protein